MCCRPSVRRVPTEARPGFNPGMTRYHRFCGAAVALVLALGAASFDAHAGRQQYEPLTDSVRTALAAAVRDDRVGEARYESLLEKVDWLAAMSASLPRRWKPEPRQRIEFLDAVRYEAQRAGLDPHLVL